MPRLRGITQEEAHVRQRYKVICKGNSFGWATGTGWQMVLGRVFHVPGAAFFSDFMKLGVALRGMIPYNRFIGSDVFSRTSGRDCGIKTTIQRKQSMENYKAGTDGDALSVSLVFVPFCCVEVSFFPMDCLFWRVVFCVQKVMERGGLIEKMEQIQTDKKEVRRERKKPEQTEQTKQAAVCIGQNEQKEVKYGRYRVTSTFAGTENLTDLLECYIDRVGSLRYGA